MDNEQDNVGGDYQYTGDDHYATNDYDNNPPEGGDPSLDNKMKIKRVLIIVGVIVVAFVVYKIATVSIGKAEKSEVSMTAAPALEKANVPASSNDQLTQLTQMHGIVKSHLERITDQNESLNGAVAQLGLTTSSMNTTLSNITENLSKMNENIQSINRRLMDLQKLETVQQSELDKEKTERLRREKVTYQVQALVPGRAWLKGTDGSTLTVSRGDNLPNYGTVDRVDVGQGLVVTSSGRILRYGIEAK
jgi:intracellular multiplication protein IcmG